MTTFRQPLYALILSLLLFWVLFGCGVKYHLDKSEKHKEIAISKGAVIARDTVVRTLSDTLVFVETRNDTTFITKTITKTIELAPEIIIKDRWQVRYETKWRVKEIKVREKSAVKQSKQATKKARAERSRSKWWVWLLIGGTVSLIANYLLRKYVLFRYTTDSTR